MGLRGLCGGCVGAWVGVVEVSADASGTPGVDDPAVAALIDVADLIAAMHGSSDLDTMLQRVVDGVVDRLGFQVALVDRLDDSGPVPYFEAVAVAGDPEGSEVLRSRRVLATGMLAELDIADHWGSLRFMPHDRLPSDAESTFVPDIPIPTEPGAWHPMDALYAPLIGPGGDLLGLLSVDLPEHGRRPDESERRLLEVYAVQAGLALHHAHERQLLEERLRIDTALREVVEAAAQEMDIVEVLGAAHDQLCASFRCDLVRIRLMVDASSPEEPAFDRSRVDADADGITYPADEIDTLKGFADRMEPDELERFAATINSAVRKLMDGCWPHRTVTLTQDGDDAGDLLTPEESEAIRLVVREFDAVSVTFAPIGVGTRAVGYMALFRLGPRARWSRQEREAVLEIGRELGLALERARLFQRERLLVQQLTDLDRHKGEMIRSVTHELKNMMTAIRGHTELLAETVDPEGPAPASVRVIGRNIERLSRMCEDLLALARVNEAHRPFVPVPVDVRAVLADALAVQAAEVLRPDLVLSVPRGGPPLFARGMPEELSMAVGNVLANAVKYTPDGGSVTLTLEEADGMVVMTCRDTGLGIAEHDLATLFDEFDRSSNPEARARPGSGLGLAIVRRVMDRHHGRVEVSSELGVGSEFRLVVPAWRM